MVACPSCRCEMRACVERGIELDICDSCNGVWLDAGELTTLAEDEENRRNSWTIPSNQDWPQTNLHCVRCSDTFLVRVVIEHHGFQGCRHCNGLFIDSGTLDSITSREDDEEQSTAMDYVAMGLLDALASLLLACPIFFFDKGRNSPEDRTNSKSNNH